MTDHFSAAQLTARKIMEDTGMSAAEVASLPLDEWARLSGRPTPAQAARAAITAQYEQGQPPAPAAPQTAPQPQGVSVANMTLDEYAVLRAQLGLDKAGHDQGIFGSGRATADAARFQAGRTALSNANVESSPRLTGRTILKQDDHLDRRSAAQRFSTRGNFNQF